jgi:multisubunit Na+/H+ antiporter MnhB subunit
MSQYSPLPQFFATRNLALWTTVLLGMVIALDAVSIGVNVTELSLASTYPETVKAALSDADVDFTEMPGGMAQLVVTLLAVGIGLASFLAFVTTAVLFVIWMRHSYVNLKALGVRGLVYGPGWAVGAWFVPFINLVRPYSIIKEIWTESNPATVGQGSAPMAFTMRQAAQSTPMFGAWWAFWIIDNGFANVVFRASIRAKTPDDQILLLWLELVSSALSIVAAALAIKVVRAITARQEQRFERLTLGPSAAEAPMAGSATAGL